FGRRGVESRLGYLLAGNLAIALQPTQHARPQPWVGRLAGVRVPGDWVWLGARQRLVPARELELEQGSRLGWGVGRWRMPDAKVNNGHAAAWYLHQHLG